MPLFLQKAQQVGNRRLSPLLLSILAVVSLVATVDPASLAEATECPITEDDGTIPRMGTGKGTRERAIFGGFVPSPVLEVAPYMNYSRIAQSDTEKQGFATIGACLSQDILKSELFNQAIIKSLGKTRANAYTPSTKVSPLPYNGKRQVRTIRTTPPEVGVSTRSKTATIIGPVQEIEKPILSAERSVSQVVIGLPSTVESPSQFGGQPLVELNPFASASQLPNNEIFHMNRSTAQAVHGGNCASECP